ncbi:hypothetical protein L829_2775 [Mycobacteroides abscessus MAB_030201_1075]|uniref:Uncharacterized protein n=3 Tax=Mycobacteroides abscessus TaxID=36809 RepID=A0A829QEV8_9MYCO|nr:hypothetical protein MA4S0303_0810 [Mycobacteroides abscessus 4S-0303]EIU49637.1 hypothetical protein MA6G0125S_2288 [Mycobacteroides abscessus 6G-0125-S]EIU54726.1 hypothetical protein MA6G0728S_4960 [Mycobacteroides abscessus 6G-0728-S]EIU61503.1 hypothetical protein MA6G1108_2277 [Mycobacteroides abscessus 6G-1108]EIU93684.1 hypothetical protein MA6G0212_2340 [Mycobacteroides abscessus 6G-0212]EIV00481.1 hypothetical protein MA6G0728R_2273 [Mycobacteroides abscessus 6G-0728-R]EIV30844.1
MRIPQDDRAGKASLMVTMMADELRVSRGFRKSFGVSGWSNY